MTNFGKYRNSLGVVLVAAAALLAACGGGGGGGSVEPPTVPPPTVQPPPILPIPPSITSQPTNQSVTAGSSATFTVVATGDPPLSYQWMRGGADVPGANSSTFILSNAQVPDNGSVWSARVSNAAGQALSAAATLTVQVAEVKGTITLVAGSLDVTDNGQGTTDGNGAAARFRRPGALSVSAGDLYVVDISSHTIRKISPSGDVTTFAGAAGSAGLVDGIGSEARFNFPVGLATGTDGLLYLVDGWELFPLTLRWHAIRTVSPHGEVTTFSSVVAVDTPGIGLDAGGNVYFASFERVVRLGLDKRLTTLTPFENAAMMALTATADGTVYYMLGNSLKKLTSTGAITTIAGDLKEAGSADGMGAQARFNFSGIRGPGSVFGLGGAISVDSAGNLYVADTANHTIRKVTPGGAVTTVAGVPGVAGNQLGRLPGALFFPNGLALLDDKTLFVSSGNAVLKISLP